MKKGLLFLFIAMMGFTAAVNAQCVPDLSIVLPGVYPDSATNLDTGYTSQPYSDTIQFKVYSTVLGFTVNHVTVLSINGLPAGFTTSSTPTGMQFNGGSNGCVLISGTAPATASVYPLVINLRFNVTGPIGTFDVDTVADDYRIVIETFSGISPIQPLVFDVSQNVPNPFNTQTEITFTAPAAGKADFRVYDMLGREIIQRTIDAVTGANKIVVQRSDAASGSNPMNKITLFSKSLQPGIYFYKINYKNKALTKKMIVTARP